jgi:hypothetical protein
VQSQEKNPKGDFVCGQDMNGVKRNERKASEATHGRANDEKQKINLNCSSMAGRKPMIPLAKNLEPVLL